MKKDLRSKRLAAAAIMVLFIVAIFARCGMSPSSKGNITEKHESSDDIEKGVSAVEEISDRDVNEAEKKLEYYWKSQAILTQKDFRHTVCCLSQWWPPQ